MKSKEYTRISIEIMGADDVVTSSVETEMFPLVQNNAEEAKWEF